MPPSSATASPTGARSTASSRSASSRSAGPPRRRPVALDGGADDPAPGAVMLQHFQLEMTQLVLQRRQRGRGARRSSLVAHQDLPRGGIAASVPALTHPHHRDIAGRIRSRGVARPGWSTRHAGSLLYVRPRSLRAWWNGRHAALRTLCLTAWGFESPLGHHNVRRYVSPSRESAHPCADFSRKAALCRFSIVGISWRTAVVLREDIPC